MKILGSMIYSLLIFFLFISAPAALGAQPQTHWIDIASEDLEITEYVDVAVTPWNQRNSIPTQWKKHTGKELHFDYGTGTPWIRIPVWNSDTQREFRRILFFNSTLVGIVTLWEEGGLAPIQVTGPGLPWKERSVKDRRAAIEFRMQPSERKNLYIRFETNYLVSTNAYIGAPYVLYKTDATFNKVIFFYLGGVTLLVLYNLIIGTLSRQKEFIVYSFFASAFAWTVLALLGILDTDLLSNSQIVFANYVNVFTALTLIAAAYFLPRFLNLDLDFKVAKWFSRVLLSTSVFCIASDLLIQRWRFFVYAGYLIDCLLLVALLFYSYFGFYVWFKKKDRFAILFLMSWAIVFISVLIWFAPLYQVLDDNSLAQYSILLGNLGELILLSVGLSQKFSVLETEKKTAQRAAEANDHYQRLVKVLSHDVANIVTSLRYHFDAIVKSGLPEGVQESVSRIRANGDRLRQVLRSVRQEILLRSFSQNERLEKINLASACQEALQSFSWELEEKDMRIDFSVPKQLEVWVVKDAFINQVLCNILGNSLKFSRSDTVLKIYASEVKEAIILSLEDQGIGLTPEQKDRIFQDEIPFSMRIPQNREGTGLGTTLVSAYMKLFSGEVKVQSKHESEGPDHGTIVSLYFPKDSKNR